jgi:hypothetical protein
LQSKSVNKNGKKWMIHKHLQHAINSGHQHHAHHSRRATTTTTTTTTTTALEQQQQSHRNPTIIMSSLPLHCAQT